MAIVVRTIRLQIYYYPCFHKGVLQRIKANTTCELDDLYSRTMLLNNTGLNGSVGLSTSLCLQYSSIKESDIKTNLDNSLREIYYNCSGAAFDNNSANLSSNACIVQNYLTEKLDGVAPPLLFYIIGAVMAIVFVLGFSENAVVLYVYIQNRKLQTVSNVFIVGLSISDIGQAIFNLPFVIIANFCRRWIFGYGGCMYYGFVTTTFGLTQISLLTVIALERYCIIVHHSRVFSSSMTKAVGAISACFLYGCGWALGPLFGWSEYRIEKYGTRCAVSWEIKNLNYLSYTLCLFTFVWFIPLLLITFGYTSIACMIYREKSMKRTIRSSSESKSTKEQKVAITVLIMIGAFVISWLPYSAVALYTAIEGTTNLTFAATLIPALIAKSSIIWNPIIYVVRHRDFRKACIKTIKLGLFCKSKQNAENTVKTDYIHRHQYQANIETRQKLIKQSSLSYSECSSSHDSCAGTGITGLMFESYDIGCREKVPKLTSKEDWKDSPHPIVRRSFEQKKLSIPSINPEYIQYLRKKDTVTKTCLRKNFLKNSNVSNVLSTVVDIECETGQSNTQPREEELVLETQNSHKILDSALHQPPSSGKASSQSKSNVRRHMSVCVPHRESYIPIRDPRWFGAEYSVRSKARSTMFETRCDEITPYRKKYRSNTGGRRHLSDSSTTVNKQSRYNKYDAKQKRSMMRNTNLHQKIEMSVFEKETSVFNSDEAQDELQGLRLGPNDEGDQEAFEAHIGACSMIRQSTV